MKTSLKLPRFSLAATAFAVGLCLGSAATFSTVPVADAFVANGSSGNLAGNNFGAAGSLAIAAPGLAQGEFQSVLKFDLAAARNSFDSEFGAGQWTVQSATLVLNASPHGNAIFNPVAAGLFNASLLMNNTWIEGTGTGGIPTTDGISLGSLQSTYINNASDQALGTFSFGGGTSGAGNYGLNLTPGLFADVQSGGTLSLRLFAADNAISYQLSSRMDSGLFPVLNITAVPEPASLVLGALGLGMLAFRGRRRE